jgi:hypothetical protein
MSNDVILESLSLADFQKYRALRPDLAQFADFILVNSYEQFVRVLYQNIDKCIKLMEEDPAIRKNDEEDRLTEDFKMALRPVGYHVTHDEKIGGHCDLVVRQLDKPYIWLGEAKIHKDYGYLKQGFNQLCTRYAQGTPDTNHGGLLIYVRRPKVAHILAEWQKRLTECNLEDYSVESCPNRPNLTFFSTHCHESSGLPFTVRHMAIVLHFDPQDKKS